MREQPTLEALLRQLAFVNHKLAKQERRATICPYCEQRMDCTTDLTGDNQPKPGDFALCDGCAMPCAFDDQLQMRMLTPDEQLITDDMQALQEARGIILERKRILGR